MGFFTIAISCQIIMSEKMNSVVELTVTSSTASTTLQLPPKGKAPPMLSPFCKPAMAPSSIKRVVLVYNPVGGRKKAQRTVDRIVAPMLQEKGIELVLQPTKYAGHAEELGKTLDLSDVDALVGMGGDGTVSDVLTGFMKREEERALAHHHYRCEC